MKHKRQWFIQKCMYTLSHHFRNFCIVYVAIAAVAAAYYLAVD
jgi:hypothetical protein